MAPNGSIAPIKCPLCTFETKQNKRFEEHVRGDHQLTLQDLWVQENGAKLCQCGCGEQPKWIDWKRGFSSFIAGHNGNLVASYGEDRAREISELRRQKLTGGTSWCKGLSKETDERVAQRAKRTSISRREKFSTGELEAWNRGLTKETDGRIAVAASALAEKYHNEQLIPWSKGKSKETDERIAQMASNVSLRMRERELRVRLDEIKRLKTGEILSRINGNETIEVIGGLDEYISDASKVIKVRCRSCSTEFVGSLRQLQHGRCFTCSPAGSAAQGQVAAYVESLVGKQRVVVNDRTTFKGRIELDIHIPSANFAIEYNGLYWHSTYFKSSIYHEQKSLSCSQMNIALLHVFEDEWRDKQDIIKSMIKHRLHLSDSVFDARKCKVVDLTPKQKRAFFEENHLDGDTASKTAFGLTYEDQLVQAISLRESFHKKYVDDIEVARLCGARGVHVRGGIGKLLNRAKQFAREHSYKSIITYVDNRLGWGNSYQVAGMKLIDQTPPRFWWTDFENRFNRFKFKADKSNSLTEADVAREAGVCKIWGCSNQVYRLDV